MPHPPPTAKVQVNFNLTPEELAVIRAFHVATYPQHQLTFGAWVRTVLLAQATTTGTGSASGEPREYFVGTPEVPQK